MEVKNALEAKSYPTILILNLHTQLAFIGRQVKIIRIR